MDDFLSQAKKEIDAERNVDYSVTAEEGNKLLARYTKDTPAACRTINPAEFFDGKE